MSVIATSVRLSQAQVFDNSVTTRAVGIAGFTVLIWDHFITFSDEVELIWKGRKSPLIYLFFLNRYFIPLSFIVNIFAYFSHVWDYDTCNRFVVYEGCMTMLGIAISGLMMFLRIRALYYTNPPVYALVFVIWSAFIAVNSWLLTHAEPVFMHAPTVISCTMVFSPSLSSIASSSAWLPLLYDTTVVSLTLFKALHRPRGAGGIARELAREGLMYYAVIFAVTLVLAVMIAATDVSIKNITAQLELCLTATMMSRITLELKRFARSASQDEPPRAPLRSDGGQCGVSRASRSEGGGGGGGGGGGDRLPRAHVSTSHYSASRARDVGIDTSFFALVTRESSVGGVSGGDLERGRGGDSGGEGGEGRGSGDSCELVDEKCDDDGGDDLEGVREETRSEKGKDIERGGGGEYG